MAADPYTAFFGGVGQGVGKGIGNAMSDTGVTSNTASSATYGTQLGGGGWSISFGDGDITSKAANELTAPPPDATPNPLGTFAGASLGGSGPELLIVALIAAALIYRLRKGRR